MNLGALIQMGERRAQYPACWHGNSLFFFFFSTVKRKCHKVGLLFTHKIHQSSGGQGGSYRDANTKLAQPPTTKRRKCSNVLRLLVSTETPLSKFQVSMIIYQLNRQLLDSCRGAGKVMDTTFSGFRGYRTYFNTCLGADCDQGYHKMSLGNQRGRVNPCLLRRPKD